MGESEQRQANKDEAERASERGEGRRERRGAWNSRSNPSEGGRKKAEITKHAKKVIEMREREEGEKKNARREEGESAGICRLVARLLCSSVRRRLCHDDSGGICPSSCRGMVVLVAESELLESPLLQRMLVRGMLLAHGSHLVRVDQLAQSLRSAHRAARRVKLLVDEEAEENRVESNLEHGHEQSAD